MVERKKRICLPTDRSRGGVVMQTRTGGRTAMPKQQRMRRELVAQYGNTRLIPTQILDPGDKDAEAEPVDPAGGLSSVRDASTTTSFVSASQTIQKRLAGVDAASPEAVQMRAQLKALQAKHNLRSSNSIFDKNDVDAINLDNLVNKNYDDYSDDEPEVPDEPEEPGPGEDPEDPDPDDPDPKGKGEDVDDLFDQMDAFEAKTIKQYNGDIGKALDEMQAALDELDRQEASPNVDELSKLISEAMVRIEADPTNRDLIKDERDHIANAYEALEKDEKVEEAQEKLKYLYSQWITFEEDIFIKNSTFVKTMSPNGEKTLPDNVKKLSTPIRKRNQNY